MYEFIDKTSTSEGTKINRESMMSLQGFQNNSTQFNKDGSITETNGEGHTLTTIFGESEIVETFVGEKTITKTTTFGYNQILEELS